MSTPMIIPIHTSGHGHLTPEGIKILLGIWVVLNIVWLVTLLIGFIPAYIKRKDRIESNKKHNFKVPYSTNIFKYWWSEREYSIPYVFDITMLIGWGTIILFILGKSVSTLF